ncbi:MAG: potassium channel family protein [Candidatus Dormibacteria bacterium]
MASTWDGVWWAITTVTTVGYGDIYPHTTGGRIVAIALMLVGIGYVAILTGAVANLFITTVNRDVAGSESEVLDKLERLSAQLTKLEEEVRRK